jgi:hypothetical protein
VKNLTKTFSLLLLGALIFTVGCEDGGSGGDDDFLLSRETTVKFVSDSYVKGGLAIITEGFGNDLLITPATAVFVQRESGSGFSSGNASEIKPDADIEYFYFIENTDFSQSPAIYEIERIFVTNPE